MKRVVCALLTACAITFTAYAQSAPRTLEVLFIGNSFTFVNNLGDMLAGIAESLPGPRIHPTLIVGGGMTLQWHYAAGDALKAIDRQRWDTVILQEQSVFGAASTSLATDDESATGRVETTLSPPTIFHESVRKFVPRIRAARATPLLLMTWARKRRPEEQMALADAYESIGRELKVRVSPAGLAWQEARRRWPDLELHLADGSHPNGAGTYLTACVLYVTLTGKNPRGAAATISGHPYLGREGTVDLEHVVPLASLTPELAGQLQQVAWETAHR
jgi:hypothetical protein